MERPLVSIITVVYNNVDQIAKTIDSVYRQTYDLIEYIVIDGDSSDGTKKVIEENISRVTKFVSEKDKGIYDAMNKGIALASGHLIGIINSGDHFEDDAVEKIATAYAQHPEHDIFHGMLRIFDESGSIKLILGNHSSFLSTGMIEHPTCFVRSSVYKQWGVFLLDYKSSSDYEFMLRVRKKGARFYFMEEILANFYTGGISSHTSAVLETLQIRHSYGLLSSFRKLVLTLIIKFKQVLNR